MLPAYRHWHYSCHPCARGEKEASGEGSSGRSPGALGGRLGTRELLASHLSGWCLELGQWRRAPGGREEGQGCVADAVPPELSSEKQLDCEVVSPLPVWESKVVERVAREVPRKHLRARRRDCATTPQGEPLGLAVWPFVRALSERQGDVGARQGVLAQPKLPGTGSGIVRNGGGWSTSCQSG